MNVSHHERDSERKIAEREREKKQQPKTAATQHAYTIRQ